MKPVGDLTEKPRRGQQDTQREKEDRYVVVRQGFHLKQETSFPTWIVYDPWVQGIQILNHYTNFPDSDSRFK